MRKTGPSRRPRAQRASRLSRDLQVRIAAAGTALAKAQALARKLQKAAPDEPAARLAAELTAHLEAAKTALSLPGHRRASRRRPD
jgi:hypothetical protein